MKCSEFSTINNPSYGGGGGAGGGLFASDIVVQLLGGKTIGKYTNGQIIPALGLTAEAVITDIATEYMPPSFNALTSPIIKVYEVGEPINPVAQTINYSVNNSGNIKTQPPNVGTISTSIPGVVFNFTPFLLLPAGSFNLNIPPGVTNFVPANETITLNGINSNNAAFSVTANLPFRQRIFWGQSGNAVLSAANILALQNNQLKSAFAGTYSFGTGGYKWFCYPATMGTATTFTDTSNNFPVAMNGAAIIVSVTNAFGVTENYKAHRTLNVLGGSINILIN